MKCFLHFIRRLFCIQVRVTRRGSGRSRRPDGALRCPGLEDNFSDFALNVDSNVKIARFKKAEYCAEAKADIERSVLFLSIIAAEALRERAGIEPFDLHGVFTDFHGFNTRTLASTEAQQLPTIATGCKDDH